MQPTPEQHESSPPGERTVLTSPPPVPLLRAFLGGVLMGLANLVPGISGGTMLVACGIYRRFIDAVSEVTRLRFTRPTVVLLATIIVGAVLSIGGLARVIHWSLVEYRWAMYSLFIGLTLGGAPIIWNMARPVRRDVIAGAIGGGLVMAALVIVQETGVAGAGLNGPIWLVVGGAAAASAMILPGISGAFLLLLLGQYETIIGAIKDAISAAFKLDLPALLALAWIVVPVGIGVLVGVGGVANILKWVMHRYERPTLGVLLGLLIAAPAGLYPFREGVPPGVGDVIKGETVTAETLAELNAPDKAKDWTQRAFRPSPAQIAGAIGLVGAGFGATVLISRLGRTRRPD